MFDYFDEEASWPEKQLNIGDVRNIAEELKKTVYGTGSIEDLEDHLYELCNLVGVIPARGRSILVGAYVA